MQIHENLKTLTEVITFLSDMEDAEFREANWIKEEELWTMQGILLEKINHLQDEAKPYIESQLEEMRNLEMRKKGLKAEIDRLQSLASSIGVKIDQAEQWIDYLLRNFKIDRMETPFHNLSYRKSTVCQVDNEMLLPEEFFRIVPESKSPDKNAIKAAIKEGKEVPWARVVEHKHLQIK